MSLCENLSIMTRLHAVRPDSSTETRAQEIV
jgi:hypothetical protein